MPRIIPLSVEAADRFLTSLPLLSIHEDPTSKYASSRGLDIPGAAQHLERQISGSNLGTPTVPNPPAAGSVPLSGRGLDVYQAEKFLNSLEADPVGLLDSEMLSFKDKELLRGISADDDATGRAPSHETEKWLTVIGGWRNRSDLNRLTPGLIKKGLIGGRIIISARQSSTYVCSTRPCVNDASGGGGAVGMLDMPQVSLPIAGPARWRVPCPRRRATSPQTVAGTSYASFIKPGESGAYDPDFLDDQSLRQGKHHTVLRLEAYQVSVIPFVRPWRLKEELNVQFRSSHPDLHPSMTLSKLRNLQKDLREITIGFPDLDISTVAIAWVYFEKLVLRKFVQKSNRKLLAGACLVLAFKYNQPPCEKIGQLAVSIRKLDRKDQLDLESLHDAELKVFVWLKFGLHVRPAEVLPHLHRMLKDMGTSLTDYYDAQTTRVLKEEWRHLEYDGLGEGGLLANESEGPRTTGPERIVSRQL